MSEGIILVNTGPGKGKTSAALGVTMRALGHGQRVVFLQFIKSSETGESRFLENYASEHPDRLFYGRLGLGFVGRTPSSEDKIKAAEAMAVAYEKRDGADLVVLDEICVALDKGLLPVSAAVDFLNSKDPRLSVILTGRNCPEEVVGLAHTVTEMTEVRHAYRQGIRAKAGVDF
jgi:cob(I)alamin adenosyltransferase